MASPLDAPGIVVGVGVGAAAAAALEPAVEIPKQEAWAANPNRILDPSLLARLVAQGGISLEAAETEARRDGYGSDKLGALVYLEQTVPGFSQALDLWRRDRITDAEFRHTLDKAGLDSRYADQLMFYKTNELISAQDLAFMVIRDIVPDPYGFGPPTSPTDNTINDMPQLSIDTLAEAARNGWDPQRFEALVGRTGLAPAPVTAANAYFRGIASYQDFTTMIAKGDLRPAYANVILNTSRLILSADQYVEAHLRGWIDQPTMYAGTAKHGMSQADTDLRFETMGRPVTFHEITTGLARGGTYPSQYTDIPEPYRKSAQESDIRPEWASLHYANRYIYPSAFVLRSLAQAGDLGGQAAVEQVLLELGWKPSFATQVSTAWTAGSASGDPHVGKAQTQLWTATHKAYVDDRVSTATATSSLQAAGVSAASVPAVLQVWDAERALVRASLSAAQIRKAYHNGVTNPATGQPWTQAEAIARLLELGYTQADAETLLEE